MLSSAALFVMLMVRHDDPVSSLDPLLNAVMILHEAVVA